MDMSSLPPAARLAALIEAGRAANPDLKQKSGIWLRGGETCALGFASLAAGVSRERLSQIPGPYLALTDAIGMSSYLGAEPLMTAVWHANDIQHASLDEIILSLREGELAKAMV